MVGTDSLPRGMMWIEFQSVTDLKRVAEMLGIKVINKRGNDYVFADQGTIYYCQEEWDGDINYGRNYRS